MYIYIYTYTYPISSTYGIPSCILGIVWLNASTYSIHGAFEYDDDYYYPYSVLHGDDDDDDDDDTLLHDDILCMYTLKYIISIIMNCCSLHILFNELSHVSLHLCMMIHIKFTY